MGRDKIGYRKLDSWAAAHLLGGSISLMLVMDDSEERLGGFLSTAASCGTLSSPGGPEDTPSSLVIAVPTVVK